MSDRFTVFGSNGFIGSYIYDQLKSKGVLVRRGERDLTKHQNENLGTVLYFAGTSDCTDPITVLDSNVNLLKGIIEKCSFEKIVYASSTRVYMNGLGTSEDSNIVIRADDSRRLFNMAKVMAEEVLIAKLPESLVLRLSNISGPAKRSKLMLPMLVKGAIENAAIDMYVDKQYAKDYLHVQEVYDLLMKLLNIKARGIYNIAAGCNVAADELVDSINRYVPVKATWHQNNCKDIFAPIDVLKLKQKVHTTEFKLDSMIEQTITDLKSIDVE